MVMEYIYQRTGPAAKPSRSIKRASKLLLDVLKKPLESTFVIIDHG